jgi:hypothetical protein
LSCEWRTSCGVKLSNTESNIEIGPFQNQIFNFVFFGGGNLFAIDFQSPNKVWNLELASGLLTGQQGTQSLVD